MLNIFKGTSEGAGISLKHIYTHEIMHNILDNLQLLNVNKTYIVDLILKILCDLFENLTDMLKPKE